MTTQELIAAVRLGLQPLPGQPFPPGTVGAIAQAALDNLVEQLEALRQTLDLFVNQPELVEPDDYIRARKEFFGSPDGRIVAYPAKERP